MILGTIEPYMAAITKNGFHRMIPDDPKVKPLVAVDVNTNFFLKEVKFESNNKLCQTGMAWWHGGMQDRIVDLVQIIADDPEELFVLFCVMNEPKFPYLLGRLVDDHWCTEKFKAAFVEFFDGMPS